MRFSPFLSSRASPERSRGAKSRDLLVLPVNDEADRARRHGRVFRVGGAALPAGAEGQARRRGRGGERARRGGGGELRGAQVRHPFGYAVAHGLPVLPGNYERYQEWSDKVRKILERFTPVVQMVSIDEAYLDLTGTERLHGVAWEAAAKIQQAVTEETQLPCSIGVGQSYLIAKVASETAKPRGLFWVPAGAEQAFLAPLPVRRIPGIGPVTEKVLYDMGARTVGELAALPEDQLREAFGTWGKGLTLKARGQDTDLWFVDDEQKSISHEIRR